MWFLKLRYAPISLKKSSGFGDGHDVIAGAEGFEMIIPLYAGLGAANRISMCTAFVVFVNSDMGLNIVPGIIDHFMQVRTLHCRGWGYRNSPRPRQMPG